MTQSSDRGLLIFGLGDVAELASYYFESDYARQTSAFVVDDDFVTGSQFAGRELVPTSKCAEAFPPSDFDMFIALAYTKMNLLRREKLDWARSMGYGITSYVSPSVRIHPNVSIGENCFIFEDNTIQPFVSVGENVTLWSGNHIGHHSTIEDDVFIASHVVVSGGVRVGRGSFLGVNSTLRDHISVGEYSVIGAGAIILGDTEPGSVYASQRTSPKEVSSSSLKRI